MRISDWSSDVCSSDLRADVGQETHVLAVDEQLAGDQAHGEAACALEERGGDQLGAVLVELDTAFRDDLDQRSGVRAGAHQVAVEDPDRKSTRLNSSH